MARKNRDFYDSDEESIAPEVTCWLCSRPIGAVTELHHPVPKSRGGKERQPVHPICHRTIHANFTNSDLEKRFATVDALLAHEEIGRFVAWIANKPSDFNAPTKGRR
jgi:5-methylcytosine-specific restriction endonuclease McrA